MKQFVLAALLGATSAINLNDAPPYFNEPTFNNHMPASSGLLMTACEKAGMPGVSCGSELVQFAEGMRGDEDLGQDITMKGQPFHYGQELAQWNPVVVKTVGALPVCHGTNGPDGVNCARTTCDGTNGPKDGESGTACNREEPAAIQPYLTDPTAGSQYQTTGNLSPTVPGGADPAPVAAATVQLNGDDWVANSEPEKVHTLETKIAKQRTTFYSKK